MNAHTPRVTEMTSAPRLRQRLPGRFPFSRVLILLITQIALSSGRSRCCYNQRGYYHRIDFLSWVMTGNGGTCKDGSVATPCCSQGSCNSICCDCPQPCWGKDEETTITTLAPTFSTTTTTTSTTIRPTTTTGTSNTTTPRTTTVSSSTTATTAAPNRSNLNLAITVPVAVIGALVVILAVFFILRFVRTGRRSLANDITARLDDAQSQNGPSAVAEVPLTPVQQPRYRITLQNVPFNVIQKMDEEIALSDTHSCHRLLDIEAGEFDIDTFMRLGDGQTGIVRGGVLKQKFKNLEVAIKSSRPGCRYVEALRREALIMEELGSHPHIVQLFGIHRRSSTRSPYIIMERCANGSLKSHLDVIRATFANPEPGGIQFGAEGFTPVRVWATQIADAMEYVHSKNIIHGDIAARNILYYNQNLVKLTDFGLSRRLEPGGERIYVAGEGIPWQWCPPEIIQTLPGATSTSDEQPTPFSKHSDIWAYGVTLYEMFSFGEEPYGNAITPAQLFQELSRGTRLPKPQVAPNETYKIMKECWHEDPEKRRSFAELKLRLHLQSFIHPTTAANSSRRYVKPESLIGKL